MSDTNPPAAAAPAPEPRLADVLFPSTSAIVPTPAAPAAPRYTPPETEPETLGDLMYGSDESVRSGYRPSLIDAAHRLQDAMGMNAEEREAHVLEVSRFAYDASLPSGEAAGLHGLLVGHMLKPADDATVQQWATESRQWMRAQYGDQEADRRMGRIRQFVSARPQLAKALEESGVGSHPSLIKTLADRADTLRLRPRTGRR